MDRSLPIICRRGNPLQPAGTSDNMFPDPHIKIFVNPDTGRENMYVYVGHDEGRETFIMRDWYVLWSEDLVHWQCRKSLARKDTYLPPDSVDCWACDVVRSPWDGKYYLYYSCGGESTGVAVSDRPDGPFVDARDKTPILPKGITPTNSYDPDILLPDDEDPRAWIVFGSDWTDHYWAMQLKENMIEVVPGSARKVPVYPDENTRDELLGVLRSDQAEIFRYGDRWYLYWAGRYAMSKDRLGPYIYRGNIGADIPHYPDGRAFIDHGSFLEWKGQCFFAVSCGLESWSYRQSWLMYLHVCDDGTLMFDEEIREYGVGQYCADWDKIQAESPPPSWPTMPTNNAYNVDTVTGATVTSTAIETAVAQAIEAAGGNLADFEMKAGEAVVGETVKLSCDTVVVGAGASGMAAALVSQQNGANTILVEKAANIGGVLVNSNLQVIKEDGTVITGLFSAGNDVAEFYNNSYPLIEGVSLGSAFNGGRMIGEQAAELAKAK